MHVEAAALLVERYLGNGAPMRSDANIVSAEGALRRGVARQHLLRRVSFELCRPGTSPADAVRGCSGCLPCQDSHYKACQQRPTPREHELSIPARALRQMQHGEAHPNQYSLALRCKPVESRAVRSLRRKSSELANPAREQQRPASAPCSQRARTCSKASRWRGCERLAMPRGSCNTAQSTAQARHFSARQVRSRLSAAVCVGAHDHE